MRFAYIDSQGNEVAIPSVDALALRIELGAIGPDTELFDAQSDRWGRADSHEIYHTLARDVSGETFLVPTPPPAPDEPTEDEAAEDEPTEDVEDEPPAPEEPTPPTSVADLGLTLAPGAGDRGGAEPESHERGAPSEPADFGDMRLDLTPDESASADEPDDASENALDDLPLSYDPTADDGTSGGGLDLEPPLDFGAHGADADEFGGGLDLEPPMSDFDPTAPPAWMEQDGPGGMDDDEGVMDFSAGVDDDDDERAAAPGRSGAQVDSEHRPAAPTRPSRPPPRRRPTRRRSAKPVLFLLALVALGAAGWYGWQQLGDRLVPPPPRPPVVIPVIPAELEPPMREIADQALVAMFERIGSATFGEEAPEAPPEEWLAGIYLGTASDFEGVQAFWAGYRSLADRLRDEEFQTFHDAYVALADSSELEADVVPMIVERADSGFLAARDARTETYELLGSLSDAALALHDFLLLNEADIVYTPARGFSGNPVEEAVPATEEIGDRMWDLVEDITNALDRLGTLDRVTRDRLNDVMLARIREIGIR